MCSLPPLIVSTLDKYAPFALVRSNILNDGRIPFWILRFEVREERDDLGRSCRCGREESGQEEIAGLCPREMISHREDDVMVA
jgi:hypothetical protein